MEVFVAERIFKLDFDIGKAVMGEKTFQKKKQMRAKGRRREGVGLIPGTTIWK